MNISKLKHDCPAVWRLLTSWLWPSILFSSKQKEYYLTELLKSAYNEGRIDTELAIGEHYIDKLKELTERVNRLN